MFSACRAIYLSSLKLIEIGVCFGWNGRWIFCISGQEIPAAPHRRPPTCWSSFSSHGICQTAHVSTCVCVYSFPPQIHSHRRSSIRFWFSDGIHSVHRFVYVSKITCQRPSPLSVLCLCERMRAYFELSFGKLVLRWNTFEPRSLFNSGSTTHLTSFSFRCNLFIIYRLNMSGEWEQEKIFL